MAGATGGGGGVGGAWSLYNCDCGCVRGALQKKPLLASTQAAASRSAGIKHLEPHSRF